MARYCVTYSEDDDWGESKDRFTTRPPADARLEEARIAGRFARLIRWDYKAVELARVNGHLAGTTTNSATDVAIQSATAAAKEAVSAIPSPAIQVETHASSKEPLRDPHVRLQRIKLLLEIAAVVITVIGGLVALIWKLQ